MSYARKFLTRARSISGLWFVLFVLVCLPAHAEGPLEPLAVIGKDGSRHDFMVELALTPDERAQGMMFRTELAPDKGMLFVFEDAERLQFWMRNTLIPLDMIFIRQNGRIANIIESAEPQTDTPRPSKGRAIAVLELAGGRAAELGIGPGDLVAHRLLGTADQP
ncbi:MAG: DUF192 domain-containing protein [Alphaproteobacteria bacterium]|nr:MAG: DUF192 domain-containing protein [Alphaproteobacteria bacterium]